MDKIQKFWLRSSAVLASVIRDAELYKAHKVMLLESMYSTICLALWENGSAPNTIYIFSFSLL